MFFFLLLLVAACAVAQTTPPGAPAFPRSFYMVLVGGVAGTKINVSVVSDDGSQAMQVHEKVVSAAGPTEVTAVVHGGAANQSCSVTLGGQCSLVCLAGAACPLTPEGCSSCQFVDLLSQFGRDPAGPCSFQLQQGSLFNATISNAVQSFNTSLCFDAVHDRPIYLAGYGGQASFFLLVADWEGGGSRVVEPVSPSCKCPGAPRAPAPRSLFLDLLHFHRKD